MSLRSDARPASPHPLADACEHCLTCGRPTPPLAPLFTTWTSEGVRADYQCPVELCAHGWYATWNPEALEAAEMPEAAA